MGTEEPVESGSEKRVGVPDARGTDRADTSGGDESSCAPMARQEIGLWGAAPSSDRRGPMLDIAPDGSVHGHDGCNGLIGRWTVSEGHVTFEVLASTRMFCVDVDTWLSRGRTVVVVDGELVVCDAQGERIGVLPPRG